MHTVSENQCGKYALLLQQARTEAQARRCDALFFSS